MPTERLTRRNVLAGALSGAAVLAAPSLLVGTAYAGKKDKKSKKAEETAQPAASAEPKPGPLVLAPLPYADTALDPVISANTLGFHHGKHHKAYVDNGNKALAGTSLADLPIVEIIRATFDKPDQRAIYNNVAQVWNHDFYWKSMRAGGGGAPAGRIAERIQADLGGYDAFREAFVKTAVGRFASGWAWLVERDGKLAVLDTLNADTPFTLGAKPLLVIDVWEHAYYLDHQNRRADYVSAWLERLVNWEFAEQNLG